jgi:hypothetical protein
VVCQEQKKRRCIHYLSHQSLFLVRVLSQELLLSSLKFSLGERLEVISKSNCEDTDQYTKEEDHHQGSIIDCNCDRISWQKSVHAETCSFNVSHFTCSTQIYLKLIIIITMKILVGQLSVVHSLNKP